MRLHVVVEGQTEETFVKTVLAPDLGAHGVFIDAHRITTGRHHGANFRGGLVRYDHLVRDLLIWMKQDANPDSWFTTMVDFYRLPRDFPDPGPRLNVPSLERVLSLEAAFADDIAQRLAGRLVANRFIPYIQLHEFEALLFSDPTAFREAFPEQETVIHRLTAIRTQFSNPEEIDDGATTAPSKRIMKIVPGYEKPVAGPLIAQRIGLALMAQSCPHFGAWIRRLRNPPQT